MTPLSSEARTVVHVSSVHPYTDNRIHYRECKSLCEAGYRVTLIAVESVVQGFPTPVKVATLPSRSRARRVLLSPTQAIYLALKSGAKIVHLHDPELIPFIPLLRLAGRLVIYDAHEDLPVQALSKPYVSSLFRPLFSFLAKTLVLMSKASHFVVCATESIALRYSPEKAVVVHNYPPLREIEKTVDAGDASTREPNIVYVGGLSELRGASVMIDAMGDPRMPEDWKLIIAGTVSGSLLGSLQQLDGWAKVTFEGQVPPDRARDIVLTARVGLVLFSDTEAHREALPTKMFEYFAAGVPVVASDFPLWRTIVTENECGLLVDQTSPEAVARAIRFYADNPATLAAHSKNARRLAVEKLNWAREAETLLSTYKSLEVR